ETPLFHSQKIFLQGGQFTPASGGQFAPARRGQFPSASGGQFDRILHFIITTVRDWLLTLGLAKVGNIPVEFWSPYKLAYWSFLVEK
ncbi:MAG: hypothetical protein Q8M62_10560, partial [Algoriphagus sp.]|uniref:hypothetical protein n=1 Tax=Algoriphagus sp. TaxID=1872435 RepID=UPI002733C148